MSSTHLPRRQLRYRARWAKDSGSVRDAEICIQMQREQGCAFVAGKKHSASSAVLSNRESLERYVDRIRTNGMRCGPVSGES